MLNRFKFGARFLDRAFYGFGSRTKTEDVFHNGIRVPEIFRTFFSYSLDLGSFRLPFKEQPPTLCVFSPLSASLQKHSLFAQPFSFYVRAEGI